jgi:hypothetical protein
MAGGVLEVDGPAAPAPGPEIGRVDSGDGGDPGVADRHRRRFICSAVVGTVVASVPYLWVLTDEWSGRYNFERGNAGANTFYDKQAEAIMHGHLWLPPGSIGIEGFVHDGRTYTYFGLLLSLFRIPLLAVDPNLNGHLTVPSMLVAWLLTALVSSLLIWRVRILLRGAAELGWPETVSLGVLMTTILSGSVLLFLAGAPRVTDEDIAWAIPITIAALFVFLGILDRPSGGQMAAAGAIVLAGALERPPPGLACIAGALLIAGWFALGRAGPERRFWAVPMAAVGLIPLAVSSVVNWLKFGTFLDGLPLIDQIWTSVNPHRRAFLAATGGKGYSIHFLPTTISAYLQPLGLRVQPTFPFFSLPVESPHVFGGYIVDTLYPTASVPATMPLLFILSCWALVVSFRPHAGRGARLMRIPLVIGAGATAVDFLLGYIAPRYLGDFLPFLVLGAAIGLVDLWRRWEHRGGWATRAAVGGLVALGLFSVAANAGLALTPTTKWTSTQAANYLRTVKSVSDLTGHPLDQQVAHGSALPSWAPAGQVFVVGKCDGLYLSTGKRVSTVARSLQEHRTWLAVEQGPGVLSKLEVTFHAPPSALGAGTALFTSGLDTVLVLPAGPTHVQFVLERPTTNGSGPPVKVVLGRQIKPTPGHPYRIDVVADPYLHRIDVSLGKTKLVSGVLVAPIAGIAPVTLRIRAPAAPGPTTPLTVVRRPVAAPELSLCRSLLTGR